MVHAECCGGGSFNYASEYLRLSSRNSTDSLNRFHDIGFRCVSGLDFILDSSAGGAFTSDVADDQAVTPAEEAKTETQAEKETEIVTDTTSEVEPEFKVSALTSQKTAKVGTNLSYVITLEGQGGFSQSLTLSVSGIPEKVETSFSSPTVQLSSNQTNQVVELEVTVPDEIEAKTYELAVVVTPTSGQTQTLPLKLTVEDEAKVAAVVETVSVKTEASSLTADGTSTTTLTVELKDTNQQALSGQTLILTADIGTVSTVKDNGDGSYTATYTAGSKAGTDTVTAKTANGKTSTVQITLTAKEPEVKTTPSFSLSSLKSEQTGQAGGTLSDLVKLQAKDGFTGKITLFATDLPDGLKVVFDPKEVTLTAEEPLQTSQMAITLGTEIKEGDYQAVVLATSENGNTQKMTVKVQVEAASLIPTSILLTMKPKELTLNSSLEVFGQLANISETEATIPDNTELKLTLTSPAGETTEFVVNTADNGSYQLSNSFTPDEVGEWQIKAEFAGNQELKATQRSSSFKVVKGQSVITFENQPTAALGTQLELVGNLQPQLSDQKVSIKIIQPDGSVPTPLEIRTEDLGIFKQSISLDSSGAWVITAVWDGNDNYDSVTKTLSVDVSAEVGKAIIVLGGGNAEVNSEWRIFSSVASYVYNVLLKRQFDDEEDIYFLSPSVSDVEGADTLTATDTLEKAITDWAKKQVNNQVPLYIYLLSHNLGDKFLLEKTDTQEKYLYQNYWIPG